MSIKFQSGSSHTLGRSERESTVSSGTLSLDAPPAPPVGKAGGKLVVEEENSDEAEGDLFEQSYHGAGER
jgi:hypothetical protein